MNILRAETIALLQRAKDYITQGWCKGHYALDDRGCGVGPSSEGAVCWCLSGALVRARDDVNGALSYSAYYRGKKLLIAAVDGDCNRSIPEFNDEHAQEDVLAVLDRAIELEKQA